MNDEIEKRLAEALTAHSYSDDTALIGYEAAQCSCGEWQMGSVRSIYALRAAHDDHRAAALRPTVDALLAEARREALNEAADRVQKIYDLQCPPLSADTYVDRGAWVAHKWWDTVLGGELKRIREEATR